MQENYNTLKLDALRELAKSHGLTGYATMRKAELIAALEETAARSSEKEAPSEKKTGKSSIFAPETYIHRADNTLFNILEPRN